MNSKGRIVAAVLGLVMMTAMLLTGCGGSSTESIQQNVAIGKKVFADESGNVYFGYKNLICSAKIEGTEISDIAPVTLAEGTVFSLAAYKEYLYVLTREGFFRYPLAELSDAKGKAEAEVICREQLDSRNFFEIFEDNIFFESDGTLYFVPTGGGIKVEAEDEVCDFEVTDKGIYSLEKDGDLVLIKSDLSGEKEIGELPEGIRFTLGGNSLFFSDGDIIKSFSVKSKKDSDTGNRKDANEKYVPWSDGENILYMDVRRGCHIITASDEQDIGINAYPDKTEGFMYGSRLISVSSDSNTLQIVDLAEGKVRNLDLEKELSGYIDKK